MTRTLLAKRFRLFSTLALCLSVCLGASVPHEKGHASYYAKRKGQILLADGKKYPPHALYAAHRTLPFGTKLKVINLHNGKEVTVLVADRGPFIKGRVIDLSWEAARRLAMLRRGVVPVHMEVVE